MAACNDHFIVVGCGRLSLVHSLCHCVSLKQLDIFHFVVVYQDFGSTQPAMVAAGDKLYGTVFSINSQQSQTDKCVKRAKQHIEPEIMCSDFAFWQIPYKIMHVARSTNWFRLPCHFLIFIGEKSENRKRHQHEIHRFSFRNRFILISVKKNFRYEISLLKPNFGGSDLYLDDGVGYVVDDGGEPVEIQLPLLRQ